MARKLGFRLRIDSLCIIQNGTTDKKLEIAKMVQIYQHATLLILGVTYLRYAGQHGVQRLLPDGRR